MTTVTNAKIILDSVSPAGVRLPTMYLVYPRFIHAEAKTHRVIRNDTDSYEVLQEAGLMDCPDLSRNASSSRAIPVAKIIEQVGSDPARFTHVGKNQPGMQAREEVDSETAAKFQHEWAELARINAAYSARWSNEYGIHKQVANRNLEAWQWMHVIVTATDWKNFFKLRLHPAADPNIFELAKVMLVALDESTPTQRTGHAPFVTQDEIDSMSEHEVGMISAARCARISYLNHDGSNPDVAKDLALARMLHDAGHASPFEHIAFAKDAHRKYANFTGWQSLRHQLGL